MILARSRPRKGLDEFEEPRPRRIRIHIRVPIATAGTAPGSRDARGLAIGMALPFAQTRFLRIGRMVGLSG